MLWGEATAAADDAAAAVTGQDNPARDHDVSPAKIRKNDVTNEYRAQNCKAGSGRRTVNFNTSCFLAENVVYLQCRGSSREVASPFS